MVNAVDATCVSTGTSVHVIAVDAGAVFTVTPFHELGGGVDGHASFDVGDMGEDCKC